MGCGHWRLASLIAICGLAISIAAGDTTSLGFGRIYRETQNSLAALAIVFLVLVAIKAIIRFRRGIQIMACGVPKKLPGPLRLRR